MLQVNMLEAKSSLSHLVKLLETKQEDIIYIARNGEEVAQLTLVTPTKTKNKRIGIAKGKMHTPFNFDSEEWNKEVASLFGEE